MTKLARRRVRLGANGRCCPKAGFLPGCPATGAITMAPETFEAILENRIAKGDVLSVARIAGIMAAKRTAELIPLCHPIALTNVAVDLELDPLLPGVRVAASASTVGKTGVEMEALTAVATALLTIYDMAKAMDRDDHRRDRSGRKSGGQSGRLEARVSAPDSRSPLRLREFAQCTSGQARQRDAPG